MQCTLSATLLVCYSPFSSSSSPRRARNHGKRKRGLLISHPQPNSEGGAPQGTPLPQAGGGGPQTVRRSSQQFLKTVHKLLPADDSHHIIRFRRRIQLLEARGRLCASYTGTEIRAGIRLSIDSRSSHNCRCKKSQLECTSLHTLLQRP